MPFEIYDVDLHDYDAVAMALDKASHEAEERGKVMTQVRLGYVLGLNKQTMSEILNGHTVKYKGKNIATNVIELIKKSAEYCELCVSDAGFTARNPAMAIFVLKAVHGYDDKPQTGANSSVTVIINDKDIPD
jgi:DNA-binding XRE family transcriptional regulator